MPGFEEKAYGFKNQARRDAQGFINSALGAGGLGYGVGAFLLSPAAPGIAAVIGAVWGGLSTFDKIQSSRNIAANNSKNVGLNPHFHPYKSQDEMNFHANKSSGNVVKTFRDLIAGKKG